MDFDMFMDISDSYTGSRIFKGSCMMRGFMPYQEWALGGLYYDKTVETVQSSQLRQLHMDDRFDRRTVFDGCALEGHEWDEMEGKTPF